MAKGRIVRDLARGEAGREEVMVASGGTPLAGEEAA
jgi:hypothetical protein